MQKHRCDEVPKEATDFVDRNVVRGDSGDGRAMSEMILRREFAPVLPVAACGVVCRLRVGPTVGSRRERRSGAEAVRRLDGEAAPPHRGADGSL